MARRTSDLLTFRPIGNDWPGELTRRRENSRFDASWQSTLNQLDTELSFLHFGRTTTWLPPSAVIQLAVDEGQIRQDGQLRAGAKIAHPGVILSIDSKRSGPLRFHTDRFTTPRDANDAWQHNLRAIVLGMEALRKVERYGLGQGTEQYVGFQALPPGGMPMGAGAMTVEQAAGFIVDHAVWGLGGLTDRDAAVRAVIVDPSYRTELFRSAARSAHPDTGGDPAVFRRLTEARDLLAEAS